jgi:hypothetical protein
MLNPALGAQNQRFRRHSWGEVQNILGNKAVEPRQSIRSGYRNETTIEGV